MTTYYFQLGSTPELSHAELNACLGRTATPVQQYLAAVDFESEAEAKAIFSRLGGSIKLFSQIEVIDLNGKSTPPPELVEQKIADLLSLTGKKVTFGLAELGRDHLPTLDMIAIKRELKAASISSRYIEGPRVGLSASVLLHHSGVTEIMVASVPNQVIIAKTTQVQDIDNWTIRDREKPYADRKKGMLPPKVARMLLNLGLGTTTDTSSVRVFDPFCGTGTVLLEAAFDGCEVVGADSDPTAAAGAQKNIDWLAKEYNLNITSEWLLGEVAHTNPRKAVDLIVTEPFLGKQTPREEQLPGIFRGLEKLYLGAFKHWQSSLKNHGKVVIILPRVIAGNQVFRCKSLFDKLPDLRYTTLSGPIVYKRPQAVVEREVWVFEYTNQE